MSLFKKLFTPLNEQNLEIKIDFKGDNQQYTHICEYKCYAYWKLSSNFFWKKAGLIHDSGHGGKISRLSERDYENLLDKAKNQVLDILKDNKQIRKEKTLISIPIKTLDL